MSWSIDFITNLYLHDRHNAIFTCIYWLTKYHRLIPCFVMEGALSSSLVAKLFFDNIVRFLGVPGEVISNKDSRLTASFW